VRGNPLVDGVTKPWVIGWRTRLRLSQPRSDGIVTAAALSKLKEPT